MSNRMSKQENDFLFLLFDQSGQVQVLETRKLRHKQRRRVGVSLLVLFSFFFFFLFSFFPFIFMSLSAHFFHVEGFSSENTDNASAALFRFRESVCHVLQDFAIRPIRLLPDS